MSDDPLAQWINQGHSSPMTDRGSASVVQVETSRLMPMLVVLAILCGMAMATSVIVYSSMSTKLQANEVETRMLEYYLLELDSKFIHAGLKDPADAIAKKLQQQRENAK